MKLQLSLVVVIAVLMAYIYWTRDWEERGGDELLLGASARQVKNWKALWRKAYPGKAYPRKDSKLGEWKGALDIWKELYGKDKFPHPKLDLIETWYKKTFRKLRSEWVKNWVKVKKNHRFPKTNAEFNKWYNALVKYRTTTRGRNPSSNFDVVGWADREIKRQKEAREKAAREEKARREKAAREEKARKERAAQLAKEKAAREEAERKAKDVCEWVKRNKSKYM